MGCASSAPPPVHQNGTGKQYPPQQPFHQSQPVQQPQPMHQPVHQPSQPMHQPSHQPPQPMHQPPPPMHQPPPPQQAPTQTLPPPPAPSQKPTQPTIQEEDDDEAPPAPVEINQGVVDTLLDLESKISALERKNVFKQYQLKESQVNMLNGQIQGMVRKQQQLEAQTQKEYQDVVNLQNNASVHQMMTQYQFAQQINKEQEEYMQALNKQEIHKKELSNATRQLESLKQTMEPMKHEADQLKQLYDQQDKLLGGIFNGKYGSDKEYKLESQLDLMMEKKQRISAAKYKWTQSRILLSHAVNQMNHGVRRWHHAFQVPVQQPQQRYAVAAEARNNFVAALQNIASAQSYLATIKFPYCTPAEMQTLNLAITHIFTDLLSPERHKHAMDCYVVVYKRSAALVQWFDFVINKTILTDVEKTNKECAVLQRELKAERMRLIKEKVREKLGDEEADKIEVKEGDTAENKDDGSAEAEKDEPEIAALAVIDAETVSQAGDIADADKDNPVSDANIPTPLSLDELAPAPNMDDIFGNIEQLKKEHEEQQKEYEKQQELAKARADQGLQDKLARRRSRRRRMQANEAEAQALNDPNSNEYYQMM